jgi:hypothetical protein
LSLISIDNQVMCDSVDLHACFGEIDFEWNWFYISSFVKIEFKVK